MPDLPEADLIARDRRHVWHPFTQEETAPDPVPIARADGALLHAEDGRQFIDLVSSWWVNLFGHSHPPVVEAIAAQAARLEQVMFAGFTHRPAIEVAERLAAMLPGDLDRVFFSDDGSTAVEVSLKLAIQHHWNLGRPRQRLIAFEGAYHGDTFGAMSAGRGCGFFDPFTEQMPPLVDTIPYPATWIGDETVGAREAESLATLDRLLVDSGEDTYALIAEPLVQGAGGMRMCRPKFLRAVAERAREAGVLLILDEVMTGFGRTGARFACLGAGIQPDLICLSKGLTGGFVPMSVTVASETLYRSFRDQDFARAFAHGHSFTANPIACAAALATFDALNDPETPGHWARIESRHRHWLERVADHPRLARPRVTGTVAAVDMAVEDAGYAATVGPRLKRFFLDQGVLIRPLGNVIYLIPPYCVTDAQLDQGWSAIAQAADEIL